MGKQKLSYGWSKIAQSFWRVIGKVENMNYQQHILLEKLSHNSTRRHIYECLSEH